jgi:hypothetical protein
MLGLEMHLYNNTRLVVTKILLLDKVLMDLVECSPDTITTTLNDQTRQ